MKKLPCILVCGLLNAVTLTIYAQSGTTGSLLWKISDSTLTISGIGTMPNYSYADGQPWAQHKKSITSVILESEVGSIGNYAFFNCTDLKSVTIPNSVTCIGEHAFNNCHSLMSIDIPPSVSSIGFNAFYGSGLMPRQASNNNATYEKSRTADNLSWNISDNTLTINGTGAMPNYSYADGQPWTRHKHSITAVVIEKGITSVGAYAFFNCTELVSVSIPNTVTYIGEHAFNNCRSLTSIDIPSSVSYTGKNAFYGCRELVLGR